MTERGGTTPSMVHAGDALAETLTVLVCSCDAYADLWEPFFTLLFQYWPNNRCRILLNTETKTYAFCAMRVEAAHPADANAPYGQRMREAIASVRTPYTLLMLDDFFLRAPVDTDKLLAIVRWMAEEPQIANVTFDWNVPKTTEAGRVAGYFCEPRCAMYKLNMQAGVWRTERLLHYWRAEDDPWRWELFANYLTFDGEDVFYAAASREDSPFDYGYRETGMGVFRGKWVVADVAPLFAKNGISMDFTKRGAYEPGATRQMMPVTPATLRYMVNRIGLRTTLGLTLFTVMKKIRRLLRLPLRYAYYPEKLQARYERAHGGAGKRILVYPFHFFPDANAVTNVVLPLLTALAKEYPVDVFAYRQDKRLPHERVTEGFQTYYFDALCPMLTDRLLAIRYGNEPLPGGVKGAVYRLLKNDRVFRPLYRFVCAHYTTPQRKLLRRLRKGNYAMLLTVSSPITPLYDALALARRGVFQKYRVQFVPYLVDPHATAAALSSRRDVLLPIEYAAFSYADCIIALPELAEDYRNYALRDFSEKIYPLPLANLRPVTGVCPENFFVPGKINCLYVGSLYNMEVRDPRYLYRMIADCPADIVLHIVCYYEGDACHAARQSILSDRPNVVWHGRMPLSTCLGAMANADILINIGNRCENQTPSKVFDYMGAGKPIVNFYDIARDTSMRYLTQYPLALHIKNRDAATPADTAAFVRFCRENAGKSVPFDTLQSLYPDGTAEAVAKRFTEILSARMPEGNA